MADKFEGTYGIEYKKLNKAQKEAVDTTEGPVMVVAGPGTGKTQILALRIGNILLNTDTKADGILCLTFTNSGVRAMQKRLLSYIGKESNDVLISTFHSFALKHLIEKYYSLLGFDTEPKLLGDEEAVFLVDDILHENEWKYIRPRTNPEMYFGELKQLISILKRERLSPEEFMASIDRDILSLQEDPASISTRGESKGKLKKEVEKRIESLERTKEVVLFYELYEQKKFALSFMDYDDVLEYAVRLVEDYEDVRADMREEYQYVLVDEHQDSSGIQNNFLKAVWRDVEMPNIFVVGDDRQLIYGFSGASFSYFEEFSHIFGKAKLITLIENYRSTKSILSLADDLLASSLVEEKLNSNTPDVGGVCLSEYSYPRDEVIGAGLYFKSKIEEGLKPEECALLVPKNYHVRNAISILRNMGLPVSSGKNVSLFSVPETESLVRILELIADPYNAVNLSLSMLDKYSQIPPLVAHKFLKNTKADKLTIDELKATDKSTLFKEDSVVSDWGITLEHFVNDSQGKSVAEIVSMVGNELLINQSKDHEELVHNVEVVRSLLHVAMLYEEKKKSGGLDKFLEYLKRLESYGSHITLSTFASDTGVQVMTLHKSKGLEYKAVWVAHMNEEVLMSEKKTGFTLPTSVREHIEERSVLSAKRELYVAITRAREYLTISYARENYQGSPMNLAQIITDTEGDHFIKKDAMETEKEILANGPETYVSEREPELVNSLNLLKDFVAESYDDAKVSVTLLNNFFECTWKWYFRNFLKLPEVKSKSLALGSAVHGAIEFILKSDKLPSSALIKGNIKDSLLKEGVTDEAELKRLLKDGEVAVSRFVDDFYKNLSKNFTPERPLQFRDGKFPHLLMYGRIDLTERTPDDEIIITDFKTGSSKTAGAIEKLDDEGRLSTHMRQLAMYSYLVAGAEKGKEVMTSRLLYLEAPKEDKNSLYSTHVGKEEIDLLVKDIGDYDEMLKSGSWIDRPCNYNSYGKNTECEYCKLAKIYRS